MEFRRKLYQRGSSYETTIPKPILFAIDPSRKHEVIFSYDKKLRRWIVSIEEQPVQKDKRDARRRKHG
ncbi:MAG: hypothetical protein GXP63_01105 [DPANN group archaeon]|nr:hypothetical protein [DPANN group archaeon]